MLYKKGRGVPRDTAQAAAVVGARRDNGHAAAQCNLGALYHTGDGVFRRISPRRAAWYEKAAVQGDATAQCSLGGLYHDGEGGTRDAIKAREWYEKAAAQGDPDAQYNLGVLYDSRRRRCAGLREVPASGG